MISEGASFFVFPDPILTEFSEDVVGFLCGASSDRNPFPSANLFVAFGPIAKLLAFDDRLILLEWCFDEGSHGRNAIGVVEAAAKVGHSYLIGNFIFLVFVFAKLGYLV